MFIFYVFCAFLRDFRTVNIFTGSVAAGTFFISCVPLLNGEILIYFIIPGCPTLGCETSTNWKAYFILHIIPFPCWYERLRDRFYLKLLWKLFSLNIFRFQLKSYYCFRAGSGRLRLISAVVIFSSWFLLSNGCLCGLFSALLLIL